MRKATALLALAVLTACDDVRRFDSERADATYRAAMSDYQAGRLTQAISGFKKACAGNPANASARFQLACLLQDSSKDYAGAFCAYREYLLLRPDSDKAPLASDRLAVCEREMAKALAAKYAPQAAQEAVRTAQEAKAAQTKAEAECERLKAALATANDELDALKKENERLKGYMRDEAVAQPSGTSYQDDIAAARNFLDEEASKGSGSAEDEISAARRLVEGDKAEPPPLLAQPADAKAKRSAQRDAEKKAAVRPPLYAHEPRPETYVIQEGDTLYKIAVRFYGRASVWNRIREANRATISTDGRLRVGQRIILPRID